MRRLTTGIIIAGITFIIGVTAASLWIIRYRSKTIHAPAVSKTVQPSTFRDGDLIIKPDGWPIPDVSKLQISQRRSKWKVAKSPVDVYYTGYKTDYMHIPKIGDDGIADPVREWSIYELNEYDIGNRKFCYRMKVWDVPLPNESGVGVVYYITYYDLDGDGKFEGWDITDELFKPLRMPQWVNK